MGALEIVALMLIFTTLAIGLMCWTTASYQRDRYHVPEHEWHRGCLWLLLVMGLVDIVVSISWFVA